MTVSEFECQNLIWVSDSELRCSTPPNQIVGAYNLTVTVHNQTSPASQLLLHCADGFHGAQGSLCSACPTGGQCAGGLEEPYPQYGYFKQDAFTFLVCKPANACPGGPSNACGAGDEGGGCTRCADRYYRLKGVCEACPDTAWLMIVGVCTALLICGVAGFYLNKKKINLAGLSIGVVSGS